MIALIRYHLSMYMKSSKFIMPLASYIIIMLMFCGGTMNSATSFFIVSVVVSYFVMVWSAFTFTESEDIIAEQISILKAGNNKKFYLSKNIFAMVWGLVYSVLGILIPTLWCIINAIFHIGEFKYFNIGNIIIALILHICVCVLGAAVGFIWHPRIMANRKIAAIGAFSLGAMGIINGPLAEEVHIMRVFKWLFPPVYNLVEKCGKNVIAFNFVDVMLPCALCLVYTAILVGISVIVLHKKGF